VRPAAGGGRPDRHARGDVRGRGRRGRLPRRARGAARALGGHRARGAAQAIELGRGLPPAHRRGHGSLMSGLWAVYRREMLALWVTPLAWVLSCAFLLLQGVSFYIVVDHYTHFTSLSV